MDGSELAEERKGRPGCARRFTATLGSIQSWILVSLVFTFLVQLSEDAGGSSLWFLDPALSVLFLGILWADRRFHFRQRIRLSTMTSWLVFVLVNWVGAMVYELSISENGSGHGGMHAKTVPSFILAQGSYVPIICWGAWLVRRFQLTFQELFFVAGMTCLYEAILFGIPMMVSPLFFLSPIVVAYYFVVYSRFLSLGMLLVDESQVWSPRPRPISFRRKLMHGALMGFGCWIIFAIWGELMLNLFDNFDSFA